jgi:hypothetical protein
MVVWVRPRVQKFAGRWNVRYFRSPYAMSPNYANFPTWGEAINFALTFYTPKGL